MRRTTTRALLVIAALLALGVAGSAGAEKFITGGDIKNGSIGLRDLSRAAKRALAGRVGPAGAQGPAGPQGAAGPAGPNSIATTVRSASFAAPADDFADGEVRCPAGMVATGGSLSPGALVEAFDGPSTDGRGWVGSALDVSGIDGFRMLLTVVCTPGNPQAAAVTVGPGLREALKAEARAAAG